MTGMMAIDPNDFKTFVGVVNASITKQSESPLKSGIALASILAEGKTIGIAIQKTGAAAAHERAFRLDGARVFRSRVGGGT